MLSSYIETGAADTSAHIGKAGQCGGRAVVAAPWSDTWCSDQGPLHTAARCCQGRPRRRRRDPSWQWS